jgi:hypothetical protein
MPRFLFTVANWADARTRQSASPSNLNSLLGITCKPLKRIVPLVAVLIGSSSRSFGDPRPRRVRRLFRTSQGETVVVTDIFDHRVNRSVLKHFETGAKLFEKVSITPMQSTKKEHHEKDWGNHDFAPCHVHDHTVKTGTKLHDGLRIALEVIEEGHEGSEDIGHSIRMTVLVECCKHLKTLSIIQHPLVVKQELKGTILDGRVDQALPDSTCL